MTASKTSTVVTSVMLPEQLKELSSGEIVERISTYLKEADPEEIAGRAARTAVIDFLDSGRWRGRSFDAYVDLMPCDIRRSVRISPDLLKQVRELAINMNCSQASVIRLAITGYQMESWPTGEGTIRTVTTSDDYQRRLEKLNLKSFFV